jgi:hypothetical protein
VICSDRAGGHQSRWSSRAPFAPIRRRGRAEPGCVRPACAPIKCAAGRPSAAERRRPERCEASASLRNQIAQARLRSQDGRNRRTGCSSCVAAAAVGQLPGSSRARKFVPGQPHRPACNSITKSGRDPVSPVWSPPPPAALWLSPARRDYNSIRSACAPPRRIDFSAPPDENPSRTRRNGERLRPPDDGDGDDDDGAARAGAIHVRCAWCLFVCLFARPSARRTDCGQDRTGTQTN